MSKKIQKNKETQSDPFFFHQLRLAWWANRTAQYLARAPLFPIFEKGAKKAKCALPMQKRRKKKRHSSSLGVSAAAWAILKAGAHTAKSNNRDGDDNHHNNSASPTRQRSCPCPCFVNEKKKKKKAMATSADDAAAVATPVDDDTPEARPLTLGQLYAKMAALPPDARVFPLSFEPCLVTVQDCGAVRTMRNNPYCRSVDRFQHAAAIVVRQHTASGLDPAAASDVARDIEPLLAQHANKPLITDQNGDVTDVAVLHRLETPGRRLVMSEMLPRMSRSYEAAVSAARLLLDVGRADGALLHTMVEALLPEGLCVELYRVGDNLYTARDLLSRFPDLLMSQAREVFIQVERDERVPVQGRGHFVLRVAPDDITEAVLDAAFGGKTPLVDRLRVMASGIRARPQSSVA